MKFKVGDKVVARDTYTPITSPASKSRIGTVSCIEGKTVQVQFDNVPWWYMIDDVKPYVELSDETKRVFGDIINEI